MSASSCQASLQRRAPTPGVRWAIASRRAIASTQQRVCVSCASSDSLHAGGQHGEAALGQAPLHEALGGQLVQRLPHRGAGDAVAGAQRLDPQLGRREAGRRRGCRCAAARTPSRRWWCPSAASRFTARRIPCTDSPALVSVTNSRPSVVASTSQDWVTGTAPGRMSTRRVGRGGDAMRDLAGLEGVGRGRTRAPRHCARWRRPASRSAACRAGSRAGCAGRTCRRGRSNPPLLGCGRVANGTGLAGSRTSITQACARPLAQLLTWWPRRPAAAARGRGKRQRGVGAAGERVARTGCGGTAGGGPTGSDKVVQRDAAVAPGGVAAVAGDDHVVQRPALARRPGLPSPRPRGPCLAAPSGRPASGGSGRRCRRRPARGR